MIRLFTTAYQEKNPARREEINECLARNVACPAFDRIFILAEGMAEVPLSAKVATQPVASRPTYQDYFDWIGENATDEDVSIIANADIYFDNAIEVLRSHHPGRDTVYALSRWDTLADGTAVLYDHHDSQDVWVFSGKPRDINGRFPVGVPRCDNRLVHELTEAGYRVKNPSFSIRCFHLHAGERKPYGETLAEYVQPPYGYVWPTNLLSLPATLLHNARHPDRQLLWRLDSRWWSKRLKLHLFGKGRRAFLSLFSRSGSVERL